MERPTVVYSFAMSLDGLIARPDGAFDWLDGFPADDSFGFDSFLDSLDGIVMGRASYEAARAGGGWDYGRWPVVVATHRPLPDPPEGVEGLAGQPAALLAGLARRGAGGTVWLFGGGALARQFLDAGLLDRIEIATIPVILGRGLPAFGGAGRGDAWLTLDFARPLASGAIHSRYTVRRPE